ncbi:MAG: rod shape-determining protein MreD [Caldithrix sp.]|nr:rod shape-determining protein MreD [Caldithrix sp.]
MNQEIKYYIYILLIFGIVSVILQSVLTPFIMISVWQPDFVLVIVLLMGMRFGSIGGSSAGLILGFIQDALSPLPVGITALPKVIAGYAAGKMRSIGLEGTMYYLWFVILILVHEIIVYLFFQYISELSFGYLIYSRVFPNTIYTTIILFFINLFTRSYFSE